MAGDPPGRRRRNLDGPRVQPKVPLQDKTVPRGHLELEEGDLEEPGSDPRVSRRFVRIAPGFVDIPGGFALPARKSPYSHEILALHLTRIEMTWLHSAGVSWVSTGW